MFFPYLPTVKFDSHIAAKVQRNIRVSRAMFETLTVAKFENRVGGGL